MHQQAQVELRSHGFIDILRPPARLAIDLHHHVTSLESCSAERGPQVGIEEMHPTALQDTPQDKRTQSLLVRGGANDHSVDEDAVGHVWEGRIPYLQLSKNTETRRGGGQHLPGATPGERENHTGSFWLLKAARYAAAAPSSGAGPMSTFGNCQQPEQGVHAC